MELAQRSGTCGPAEAVELLAVNTEEEADVIPAEDGAEDRIEFVEKERVGTAFGLMTMVQNVGLAFFPWLNGRLRDLTHDYRASMIMFAGLGAMGLVFAHYLWRTEPRA